MSLKKVKAILWKQLKDTFSNKAVLIQFLMFPILAIVMETTTNIEGLEDNYFVILFATMYVGMAPMMAMASVIAEEKEKHTLRMLIMSNVSSFEYLLGVGLYVILACLIGAIVMGVTAGYVGVELIIFVGVMMVGAIVSALLGAAIGVWSKNHLMATSIVIPVMIGFSFLPMIAMFNEIIEKISKYTYTQQVNYLIHNVESIHITFENIIILVANFIVIMALFVRAYRRSKFA